MMTAAKMMFVSLVSAGLIRDEGNGQQVNLFCAICGDGWHHEKSGGRQGTVHARKEATKHVADRHWPEIERAAFEHDLGHVIEYYNPTNG